MSAWWIMTAAWLLGALALFAVERWARGSSFFTGLGLAALGGMLLALFGASWPWQFGLFIAIGPLLGKRLGRPRTVSLILPPERRTDAGSPER